MGSRKLDQGEGTGNAASLSSQISAERHRQGRGVRCRACNTSIIMVLEPPVPWHGACHDNELIGGGSE